MSPMNCTGPTIWMLYSQFTMALTSSMPAYSFLIFKKRNQWSQACSHHSCATVCQNVTWCWKKDYHRCWKSSSKCKWSTNWKPHNVNCYTFVAWSSFGSKLGLVKVWTNASAAQGFTMHRVVIVQRMVFSMLNFVNWIEARMTVHDFDGLTSGFDVLPYGVFPIICKYPEIYAIMQLFLCSIFFTPWNLRAVFP